MNEDELTARAFELEHAHINRDADDELAVLGALEWWAMMLELWDMNRDNWYVQAHWDFPPFRRMRELEDA